MTAQREDSVETPWGWVVVAASTLMVGMAFGAGYLVVVGLKPIAAEFGWPRSYPSLANSLLWFGAGFGGILMGLWSDRRGTFPPVALGATMVGAGVILAGFATNPWSLWLSYGVLVGAFGTGAIMPPLLTNTTRWFDRRRGIAVAIVSSGQSAAGAFWPPIFRWVIENYGWREMMIAYGVICLGVMIPTSLVFRRGPPGWRLAADRPKERRDIKAAVLGLPPNLVLAMLCGGIICCCVAMAMPLVHIVAYCSDLGFAAARGAEMLSLLLFCGFFSRIAFGALADRIGGLMTILSGSSVQIVFLSLYVWTDTLFGLYLISAMFGVGFGGIIPCYTLAVREHFPVSQLGWRVGAVFLSGTTGMAAGGLLGGLIFDLTGAYESAFLTGVAFNVANLLLIMTLVWHDREPRARPAALAPAQDHPR